MTGPHGFAGPDDLARYAHNRATKPPKKRRRWAQAFGNILMRLAKAALIFAAMLNVTVAVNYNNATNLFVGAGLTIFYIFIDLPVYKGDPHG